MKRIFFFMLVMAMVSSMYSQQGTRKHNKSKKHAAAVKPVPAPIQQEKKLPLNMFITLVDSTDFFVINHATQFQHVDLPKKNFDTFNSYIKDSVATEVPGLKSLLYYNYTLKDGRIIIGDIYWNDTTSYIVFKIYDKKYVNYFRREGVDQLRSIFKL